MIYKTMRLLKIGMHGRLRDPLSWVNVVLSVLRLGFNPQLLLGNLLQCLAYPPQESLCTHTHTYTNKQPFVTWLTLFQKFPHKVTMSNVSAWPKAGAPMVSVHRRMLYQRASMRSLSLASSSFPERSTTLAWDGLAFPSLSVPEAQSEWDVIMCP